MADVIITLTPKQLEEVQAKFLFAWEKTDYRANLVALRFALGLNKHVYLPVDDELKEMVRLLTASGLLPTKAAEKGEQ